MTHDEIIKYYNHLRIKFKEFDLPDIMDKYKGYYVIGNDFIASEVGFDGHLKFNLIKSYDSWHYDCSYNYYFITKERYEHLKEFVDNRVEEVYNVLTLFPVIWFKNRIIKTSDIQFQIDRVIIGDECYYIDEFHLELSKLIVDKNNIEISYSKLIECETFPRIFGNNFNIKIGDNRYLVGNMNIENYKHLMESGKMPEFVEYEIKHSKFYFTSELIKDYCYE